AATGLHTHHIVEVHEQGPTALFNLAKLCSFHHDLRHHHGFTLAGRPGNWQWIPPGTDPDPPDGTATQSKPSSKRSNRSNRSDRSRPPSKPSSTRPTGRNDTTGSNRRRPKSDDPPRLFPKQE
ncbi:MAG TPA: hypothetical protein VG205_03360, partial [Acidimicrobiales bacterium]|nr:hypothetical protein [Acidimicrobiales bacterium]